MQQPNYFWYTASGIFIATFLYDQTRDIPANFEYLIILSMYQYDPTMQYVIIWRKTQEKLQEKLDADSFARYLSGIIPVEFDEEKRELTLGVANDFVALWLDSNYKEIIVDAISSIAEEEIKIRFKGGHQSIQEDSGKVAKEKNSQKSKIPAKKPSQNGMLARGCRPDFTFDNFIVGDNNRICHAAALAVSDHPGKVYNPLFIYGGVGLGKTHLLQAIIYKSIQKRLPSKIRYLTSEEFVNSYVEAMRKKALPAFRQALRGLDILIIDDVQFFEGKVGSSEEFFHTFNTLHNSHKQIVMASDRNPQEIRGLEQRLVSRFEWGVSAEILAPDLETRVAILKKKQETKKVQFDDDILFSIASCIRSNIRNLESALTKLGMHVSIFEKKVTKEKVEQLLRGNFTLERTFVPSISTIQKTVADFFDIRIHELLGRKRIANITIPRMVAMYLSREITNHSLASIGNAFKRNHATVMHAIDAVEKRMKNNEDFRNLVEKLHHQLLS